MAFCTNCGSSMEGQFCTSCGARADAAAPGGAQPAAPPPAYPQAAPEAGAPAPQKSKVLLWVLLGCGGLIVIVILVMMAAGFFFARKASEFGKNPGFAAAKMMASLNPNVEVVRADENTGRITLRDKKTGKTVTMDFRDIQKGRISFEGEGGEKVDIQGEGEGGSMTIKGPDGSMQFGQGSLANVPSWVPRYPGAQALGAFTSQQGGEEGGTFQLQCSGSVEEVAAFYEREMKSAGMKIQKTSMQGDKEVVMSVVGTDEARQHTVSVTASNTDKGTVAHVMYVIRK
jgi:uncharacterized protein YneF (UPF0154 family)